MSEDTDDTKLPIDSFEEFIRRQKLVDWPLTIREYEQMPSDYLYNSVEEIEDYLKRKVPFPVEMATSISSSMNEVWGKVSELNAIFDKSITLQTKSQSEKADHPYPEFVEQVRNKLKEQVETESLCPDIMEFEFPGFSNLDHTDIPGLPSTPQHLDCISEAQGFNPGFLKIWKPFFLSEYSITVFKDMFWWFFLHSFKPSLEDESALFDCIATGFVSLLLMVHNDVKDKLFKVYADCLSQAIYAAFCEGFPQSLERFDDNFKTNLTEVTSLWVSGVKPRLFSWKNWKLGWLTPAKDVIKAKKNSVCDFQTDLQECIMAAMGPPQTPTTVARRSCGGANAEASLGSYRRSQESHCVGPGPQFDRIYFRPWGQSLLVARYLQLHGIPSVDGCSSRKVKRTEIANVPPEKPTYQEVISETQDKIGQWRQKCKQFVQQTDKEILSLHKKKLLDLMELQSIQKQITSSRAETKIYSEGIVSQWEYNAETARQKQRLQSSIGQTGDSDDGKNAEESPKPPEEPSEQA